MAFPGCHEPCRKDACIRRSQTQACFREVKYCGSNPCRHWYTKLSMYTVSTGFVAQSVAIEACFGWCLVIWSISPYHDISCHVNNRLDMCFALTRLKTLTTVYTAWYESMYDHYGSLCSVLVDHCAISVIAVNIDVLLSLCFHCVITVLSLCFQLLSLCCWCVLPYQSFYCFFLLFIVIFSLLSVQTICLIAVVSLVATIYLNEFLTYLIIIEFNSPSVGYDRSGDRV